MKKPISRAVHNLMTAKLHDLRVKKQFLDAEIFVLETALENCEIALTQEEQEFANVVKQISQRNLYKQNI